MEQTALQPQGAKEALDALNSLMVKQKIINFDAFSKEDKLNLLQIVPKAFMKTRKVGSKMCKYVPHPYARRALNFVFNFRISTEVQEENWLEYMEQYYNTETKKQETRQVYEASVLMKFTFTDRDGNKETRTVRSSHKGYNNSGTTRYAIMEGAHSLAWTKVASSFGIGLDLEAEYSPSETKKKTAPVQEEPKNTIASGLPY